MKVEQTDMEAREAGMQKTDMEAREAGMQKADGEKTEDYVCIDLETTGLNPKTDRIIEIGAVRVEGGEQTGVFETFINPGRKLEEKITQLTGIRDEDLRDAPKIGDVLPELLEFTGERVLLGHSVLFDYSFLKKAAVNHRLVFEREGIDTLKIARKYLAFLESRSLDALCRYYGIPHRAHRALEDARATAALYGKLCGQFLSAETAADFCPKALRFQVKRDTPATKSQLERLYKLLDRHKLNTGADLSGLTRSEASRYTDRILAAYGR